jgi:hypothetical protein
MFHLYNYFLWYSKKDLIFTEICLLRQSYGNKAKLVPEPPKQNNKNPSGKDQLIHSGFDFSFYETELNTKIILLAIPVFQPMVHL